MNSSKERCLVLVILLSISTSFGFGFIWDIYVWKEVSFGFSDIIMLMFRRCLITLSVFFSLNNDSNLFWLLFEAFLFSKECYVPFILRRVWITWLFYPYMPVYSRSGVHVAGLWSSVSWRLWIVFLFFRSIFLSESGCRVFHFWFYQISSKFRDFSSL